MRMAMPQRQRSSKREVLLAKGIAGAVLLRIAASSQTAAIGAVLMMAVVIVTPVLAVWAMLLTAFMMFIGAASYWPTNLLAMCLGTVGVGGALNGVIISYEKYMQRRAPDRATNGKQQRVAASPASRRSRRDEPVDGRKPREDDDGSGGLVALLLGALTAAIVGALP